MKSSSVTSFRKNVGDSIDIPGTRVSVQNAQLLTSTGSSTLDFFLGGGLAIGTICLIEEDRYGSYSNLLLKYFLAEGVVWKHSIFLASGDKDPNVFLEELPAIKAPNVSSNSKPTDEESDDDLKIAWRYRDKKEVTKVESHNIGFDLSKTMPDEILKMCSLCTWNPASGIDRKQTNQLYTFLPMPYSDLYKRIKDYIENKGLQTSTKTAGNILRIGINSIASPLWQCTSEEVQCLGVIRFLYALKALLRTSFAVAMVTVPSFLLSNTSLLSRMLQICDTDINLESFVGSSKKSNPLFKDFDGLIHIKKLPVLNTFMYQNFITSDLAFKLKKRGLLIECLHLPPDLEDDSQDLQTQFGCSGLGKKLEF